MAVKTPSGWYDISVPLKQGMNYFPTDPVPPKIYRYHDVELGARVTMPCYLASIEVNTGAVRP